MSLWREQNPTGSSKWCYDVTDVIRGNTCRTRYLVDCAHFTIGTEREKHTLVKGIHTFCIWKYSSLKAHSQPWKNLIEELWKNVIVAELRYLWCIRWDSTHTKCYMMLSLCSQSTGLKLVLKCDTGQNSSVSHFVQEGIILVNIVCFPK